MPETASRDITTLPEMFLETARLRDRAPALLRTDGSCALTWNDYASTARRLAAGLADLGVQRTDTLGLLLSNRPEFHIADVAGLMLGAVPFSLYNTSAPQQLVHLLRDSSCRIVITEAGLLDRLRAAVASSGTPPAVIVVVDTPQWTHLLSYNEIGQLQPVATEDVATLIYTSGTTGPPKGVELTHRNILTMTGEVASIFGTRAEDRAISALPMAHIAERASTHYLPMTVGLSVVCCPNYEELVSVLARVQPDIFFSPPRLWEKLRSALGAALLQGGDQVTIRRQFGFGRLRVALTGAAPCPPSIIEFYRSIGIALLQLYGMSETTGVVSIPTGRSAPDSVGLPLPSTEVRLGADGELFVRSPMVMAGYRNRPDVTAEVIDADGWLRTGDIAALTDDGQLTIIGRKKELIINAAGKNMSPTAIESRIKESSPLIGQVCVIGDGRPFNVALIVIDGPAAAALAIGDDIHARVADAVAHANERLSRVEQIKRYTLLTDDWLPDSDELTPTMKLKRKPIAAKYATQIEEMYNRAAR